MNTIALTDFFVVRFSALLFFWVFVVSGFGVFFERNEKHSKNQKTKKEAGLQNANKKPLSLATKQTTQKQNNTN